MANNNALLPPWLTVPVMLLGGALLGVTGYFGSQVINQGVQQNVVSEMIRNQEKADKIAIDLNAIRVELAKKVASEDLAQRLKNMGTIITMGRALTDKDISHINEALLRMEDKIQDLETRMQVLATDLSAEMARPK